MLRKFYLAVLAVIPQILSAQNNPVLQEKRMRQDMEQMAGDQFLGREAGTVHELTAAAWLADKAKLAGMAPAGDNGTYFQYFDMYRQRVSPLSGFEIDGKNYRLWDDILVQDVTVANVDAEVLMGNGDELPKGNLSGKAVVVNASMRGIMNNISLFARRYPTFVKNRYINDLQKSGAAALIIIADKMGEEAWVQSLPAMSRGFYGIKSYRDTIAKALPVFWVHGDAAGRLKNGSRFKANLLSDLYTYPSVNVVGMIAGSDPKLKNEYVLISGHHDHDGIRLPYDKDDIYNGADDNASTCVAMLEMARAYKAHPPKRSILFVFHGAEERGLLGSRYYAAHPTVGIKNIVAVLNGDMIGRNDIDSAALLGSSSPHKNSDDLVKMAFAANNEGPGFKLNTDWDKPEHPEYFYFRSDHLPYARLGVPAIFFTSMLHDEYHTPMDDAEGIDYRKLTKMANWIYQTSLKVANAPVRPTLLPDVKFER